MSLAKSLLLALPLLLLAAAVLALAVNARDRAEARRVEVTLAALAQPDPPRFDPAMTADLPEVAQRYFARAIAPGTPLHRVVQLEMSGSFTLNGTDLPMTARQILAPPAGGFVWQATIGQGLTRFAGSDGHSTLGPAEDSWTRFWLHNLIPLARIGGTEDHARAAATRTMMEAIWAPASLLPGNGVTWVQTGPDSAEIRLTAPDGPAPMTLTLNGAGDPVEVVALRWSDANPQRRHRLQPFGGRVLDTAEFEGFRIPVRVELGNMYGTPEHAPFFRAAISRARFAPDPTPR